MITDQPVAFSPEDLQKNFERLQTDLNVVQNELDQALSVWRTILAAEKQEFKKTLEDRARAWDRDETQWQTDRQAYEKKIQDLETFFQQQLGATEKNAVRALNELDAAWQQERLRWQQTYAQQAKDTRQQDDLRGAAQQQLEQRIQQLQEQNADLQARLAPMKELETRLAQWQSEKTAWQQTLSERLHLQQENEARWDVERQHKEHLINSLQQELVMLERQLRDAETTQAQQQQRLDAYVTSLETQITALQDFITQIIPPSHPLRRKTDHLFMPPTTAGYPRGR